MTTPPKLDRLRVLLVADMRSPHALGWARGMLEIGLKPIIISSRRLDDAHRVVLPDEVRASIYHEPHDIFSRSRLVLTRSSGALHAARRLSRGAAVTDSANADGPLQAKHLPRPGGVGRLELPLEMAIAHRVGRAIDKIAQWSKPVLIHALRIPFEGIAATKPASRWPLAVSTWGSDLAVQAPAHPTLARATRQVLKRVIAVHADCQRDIELAHKWGAPAGIPILVAAGNMGFDNSIFHPGDLLRADRQLIVYPRGPSTFVNYLGFLRAAITLAAELPNIQFVGIGLKNDPSSEALRRGATDPHRIILTGPLTPGEMAALYRRAIAVVSPSISDGTPNSVLEGMACGALPIVGDIPSLAELLRTASPQSLIDPRSTDAIQEAIASVVDLNITEWERSSAIVRRLATSEWSREASRQRVISWYGSILGAGTPRKPT